MSDIFPASLNLSLARSEHERGHWPTNDVVEFCQSVAQGNLYIKIDIEFPKDGTLPASALEALRNVLPRGPDPMIPDDAEEVRMHSADLDDMGARGADGRHGGATGEDDDDDDPRGGQRVACNQQ